MNIGLVTRTVRGLPIIDLAGVEPTGITLSQVASDYLREWYATECAGQDMNRPRQVFWKAFEVFGMFRDVTTLTRADSRLYTARRLEEGVKPSSIRRELTFILAAINHARREERIKVEIRFQMPAAADARVRWLTRDEHRLLMLTPMPARLRRFFILAFGTGARARAIEELTWSRVDLPGRTIDFRVHGMRYKNKRRIVAPISDALLPRLEAMHAGRKDDYVIGLGESGRCTSTYHQARRFMREAGITGAVPRHVCRHTFASWLLQNGASIYDVAKLLGDTVGMVERVYGHLSQDNLRNAVNKLH